MRPTAWETFWSGAWAPSPATWRAAAEFCRERRAILLVDPPADWSEAGDPVAAAADGATALHGAIGIAALQIDEVELEDGRWVASAHGNPVEP